ncbi:MAG: beta-lactamase family protein [Nonomuraea sp.]|nr:beta-lactamase family protein [Nonomuraea sp.]NUP67507.1 beta-lactamase family protein [Nonomuraea sp.]NUT42402.1 beta-lactamase family protein [Thermoactinospora sp.]
MNVLEQRMRAVLGGYVERGEVPGLVALVHHRGETRVVAAGTLEAGGKEPVAPDTIFRIASLTKAVTAVAAMILVEECVLRLDDPIDDLIPELAGRRVLRGLDGPLDDTVPAVRAITVRDLLTFRLGIGQLLLPGGDDFPIVRAMRDPGVDRGPDGPDNGPDEWLARLGALPLMYQPGERWSYHTPADVLGVLIARATGRPLPEFVAERVLEPLGMRDTGYHLPADRLDRLAVSYQPDGSGGVRLRPDPREWDKPPRFPSGGGGPGLLSTAVDYAAFCRMLLHKGRHDGGRILSRASAELMTTDHLTPAQKAGSELFLGSGGWGFGVQVDARADHLYTRPGRFGWAGGLGTTAYTDPSEGLVGVLFTQVAMTSPVAPKVFDDFWTVTYTSLDG